MYGGYLSRYKGIFERLGSDLSLNFFSVPLLLNPDTQYQSGFGGPIVHSHLVQ